MTSNTNLCDGVLANKMKRDMKCDVLGVKVSALNMRSVIDGLLDSAKRLETGYVCVSGVHGVMEAQRDRGFMYILNSAFMNVPDGMPLVWVGWTQGYKSMDRVYGPDLMYELCRASVPHGYTHFFYGGKAGVAERVKESLCARIPGLRVVGTFTPPFRILTSDERNELVALTGKAKPDFFWVGLSTPKQERFMAEYLPILDTKIMLGVGAAFDLHTGAMKDAPNWMKRTSLQWLHRLFQEPARLWRRYLVNNPAFIVRISLQLAGSRLRKVN